MDYPTPLQQRMISGYFELKEVAKKNHNDIVRLMHSLADRQL